MRGGLGLGLGLGLREEETIEILNTDLDGQLRRVARKRREEDG